MSTEWVFQNPDATIPLRLSVDVTCNTSRDKILANVLTNSASKREWVKSLPAHGGIGLICGSGPSIADHIEEIRRLQEQGAKVFALNGCAAFLASKGIGPDYQVLMDAQPQTAELIGSARQHLFASQVDPECFEIAPDAILWHATYGDFAVDEQEGFPARDEPYCLIGAAVSVGNTALPLLYALGYRDLRVYGMDSSHRAGAGHVLHQAMNEGDPTTIVQFGGAEYVCSLTMRMQADTFMARARLLGNQGCRISVIGSGLLPAMFNAPPMEEAEKYAAMWERQEYRSVAPGEHVAQTFVSVCRPEGKVIDFGCGTGRGALEIMRLTECELLLVDFTANSRDPQARHLPFLQADLTRPIPAKAPHGFCTDVLEHIPPHQVDAVIQNVMASASNTFFQISLVPDSLGALIGQPLHLSVHPFGWWADVFTRLGYRIAWSEDKGDTALFYITR